MIYFYSISIFNSHSNQQDILRPVISKHSVSVQHCHPETDVFWLIASLGKADEGYK